MARVERRFSADWCEQQDGRVLRELLGILTSLAKSCRGMGKRGASEPKRSDPCGRLPRVPHLWGPSRVRRRGWNAEDRCAWHRIRAHVRDFEGPRPGGECGERLRKCVTAAKTPPRQFVSAARAATSSGSGLGGASSETNAATRAACCRAARLWHSRAMDREGALVAGLVGQTTACLHAYASVSTFPLRLPQGSQGCDADFFQARESKSLLNMLPYLSLAVAHHTVTSIHLADPGRAAYCASASTRTSSLPMERIRCTDPQASSELYLCGGRTFL